jgi:hypothetical protein
MTTSFNVTWISSQRKSFPLGLSTIYCSIKKKKQRILLCRNSFMEIFKTTMRRMGIGLQQKCMKAIKDSRTISRITISYMSKYIRAVTIYYFYKTNPIITINLFPAIKSSTKLTHITNRTNKFSAIRAMGIASNPRA